MPGEGLLIVGLLIAGAPCSPPARIRTVRTMPTPMATRIHRPTIRRATATTHPNLFTRPLTYAPNRSYYGTFDGFTPTRSYSGNSGPQITFTFPSSGYP
jgi:hypothetical protein